MGKIDFSLSFPNRNISKEEIIEDLQYLSNQLKKDITVQIGRAHV